MSIARLGKTVSVLSGSLIAWNWNASISLAHPDHPVTVVSSNSPLHYLAQPEHALPLVVAIAAVWWLSRLVSAQSTAARDAKKLG